MIEHMKAPHEFLAEDLGDGDITTEAIAWDQMVEAIILVKQDCVVAGIDVAAEIFGHVGLETEIIIRDGDLARNGDIVMKIRGRADALLKTERLALNFIQRLSGIATITRELVDACRAVNPVISIAATRKTTPGLRKWEKDAVELGGGVRHREGLYDQYLIKDNHLRLVSTITEAVAMAREHGKAPIVEVEVVDIAGAEEAAGTGADIIMLDNMAPEMAREAATRIRKINPKARIEISGRINPDNILAYAEFADVISLGWLTHSVKAADFSLEIVEIK
ncbi:MAG: carboxylating nicotinate-nucleotide diphosphorylase [Candidatus Thermoplasmatota archaeon]|nr:carboxylating nicotinate-nucleotide diphosphorylase [Euryarchaeota archaeon]MBU4032510.1 carboxylating nicotinate-nucleotide diphosphorylase [Candidatus Thermoplasmatota archaeon]MBU4070710.1 carboxylating nicotinate-nucleotide diphosphorylase [Candidatus Thermoplasmatota archaeon]MBU4143371.1 carboxylating nicotinate-nucleotide diphosphorylase [Candidatus Thermoplasmatota archaeon]MBU4591197.1 carboxylating nicotinate-nucleotide diphosphorylase [Candidatus Thermoplasmatota archaeon]